MVQVQYAEPKVFEPLRIEVLPADSNQPVLVKERGSAEFKPAPAGDLARPERGSNHPVNAPPKQTAKQQSAKPTGGFTKSEWKTRRRSPSSSTSTRHRTGIDAVGGLSAAQESTGLTISGFTVGVIDELRNVPLEQAYRDRGVTLSVPEFEGGYEGGRQLTDYVRDSIDNGLELLKKGWESRPTFGLPELELPTIKFPEIETPQLDFPKLDLPEFDFPELKRPEFELPDTIQPEFELPDWQFDFPTINFPELERAREIEEIREREKERKKERIRFKDTDVKTKRLIEQLDEGCILTLFYCRIRYRNFDQYVTVRGRLVPAYSFTSWEPFEIYTGSNGRPNENKYYQAEEGSDFGDSAEYPNYYYSDLNYSDFYPGRQKYYTEEWREKSNYPTSTIMIVQLLVVTIPKTFRPGQEIDYTDINYFLYNDARSRPMWRHKGFDYIESFNEFAFLRANSTCLIKADTPPLEIPPIPEEELMDCCNCSDIALIFKKSLQSMRYSIEVPVVSCELEEEKWVPKVAYKKLEIFAVNAATATAQAELYRQIATQAREICDSKNIVTRTSEVIGVDEYPASLPSSLISKDEGFLGNLIPNPKVEIPNLTKLIGWYIERFDEIMGQFEIPIEIKDSDPTTPGEQPVGIKLPNIAESIAEIVTLLFTINMNSEILVSMGFRTLLETGQDKQQNFISYKLLLSLVDYLGFKYRETEMDLPMMFTPGKTRFDEILQETTLKVAVAEFDEKFNFEADLMRFRKAASIIDSVYFRKIDPNGDIKAQILSNLRNLLDGMKSVNGDLDKDFEKFVTAVEVGFTGTPGISDSVNPYGRNFKERPRVKDLTNNQPPTQP